MFVSLLCVLTKAVFIVCLAVYYNNKIDYTVKFMYKMLVAETRCKHGNYWPVSGGAQVRTNRAGK